MHSEVKTVISLALLYAFRMLGLFMVLPVLMLYGDAYQGASPMLLGLALGVYGLTQALFQIPLGLLSDIFGRKPVIWIGMGVFAAGSVIAGFSSTIMGLIIGRALQGSGAVASAIMAMVADLTSEQNRTKAMAVIGASIGLSFSIAMVVGPGVAALTGLQGVFFCSGALAIVGMLVLIAVPKPRRLPVSHRDTGAVPALIRQTLSDFQLLRLNFGIFSLHFVLMAAFVVIPDMLESQYQVARADHWSIYLGVLGLAFILMLPLVMIAERKRMIKAVFILAVSVLAGSLIALAEATLSYTGWLLVLLVFFIAFNLLEATLPSLVSKLAPAGAKGTAMGLYSTSQFLGAFCGGVSGGWVLQNYGDADVFLLSASVTALWLLLSVSMRSPKYLSSLCVAVDEKFCASMEILQVSGVEEALLVSEESMLYLKVDKKSLDEKHLNRVLQSDTSENSCKEGSVS